MAGILALLTALSTPFCVRLFGNGSRGFFLLLAAVLGLLGAVPMLVHIPVQTYIQAVTPNVYMSRVFSIVGMLTKGGMPLGALIYGLMIERLAVHWTMLLTTLLTLVISAAFLPSLSKTQPEQMW